MPKQPDYLDGYVEVKDRIAAFHEKYPDGSLQSSWEIVRVDEAAVPNAESHRVTVLLIATAKAYRTPDDERPGIGTASEPFPGKTPYTKDSELMNAETSAWGRALAALGFEVSKAIASREEVSARQGNGDKPTVKEPDAPATSAQKGKLTNELNKRVAMKHHADLRKAFKADTKGGASNLIEALMTKDVDEVLKEAGITPISTLPLDEDA